MKSVPAGFAVSSDCQSLCIVKSHKAHGAKVKEYLRVIGIMAAFHVDRAKLSKYGSQP